MPRVKRFCRLLGSRRKMRSEEDGSLTAEAISSRRLCSLNSAEEPLKAWVGGKEMLAPEWSSGMKQSGRRVGVHSGGFARGRSGRPPRPKSKVCSGPAPPNLSFANFIFRPRRFRSPPVSLLVSDRSSFIGYVCINIVTVDNG